MNDKNKTNHEEEDDNKSTTSSTSSEKIFKPSSISQLLTTDEIIDNLQTSSSNPGMYERVKSGIGLGLFKKTEDSPDNSPPESLYETPNDESSGTYYFYQDHVSKIQSYPPSTNAPYQTTNLYLDSITEEDSDDLRSLSSASSLISPQLIPHTSYSELIARLPSEEENLIEEDNDPSSILDNTTPLGSIIILSHITIEQGEEPEYNDTIEEILSNHSSITSTKSSESRLGHLNITNPEEEENIGNSDLHLSLSPTSLSISGEIAEIEGDNIDIISIKDSASPVDDLLSEATESVTDSVATTFYNNTSISKNKTLNNPEEEILDIFVDEELPLDPFTDNISPSNTIISTGGILNKEIDLKNSHKNQEIVNNRKKEILDNSNMEAHQDRDTSEMIVTDLFARGYPIEETGFLETDRFSPESASIILDRSRDSLLDQSICSNPRDETHIMEAAYVSRHYEEESDDDNKNNDNNKLRQTVTKTFVTTSEGKKEGKRNSDILDEDLPPPPEQLKTVTSYTPQPLRPTILPPAPPSMVPKQFKDSNDSSITSPIDKTPESSGRNSAQRLPQFLYGYGTVGPYQSTGNSPTTTILVTSPWISSVISKKTTESPKTISTISSTEEEVENKNNNGIGKVSKEAAKEDDGASSYPNYFRKYDTTTTSPILHSPNYPESSRSTASTVRNIPVKVTPHTESTSDKLSTHISTGTFYSLIYH
uniref:PH domain-containing protein n=1 Tax=Parastrongyloides trichosuri TaxID=131310 RepID=A0A0N4Z4I1_PARTI